MLRVGAAAAAPLRRQRHGWRGAAAAARVAPAGLAWRAALLSSWPQFCPPPATPAVDEVIDIVDGPKLLTLEQVRAVWLRAVWRSVPLPPRVPGGQGSGVCRPHTPPLRHPARPQLGALFQRFGGVLEEYEERRAERMARMQSEVRRRGSRLFTGAAFARMFPFFRLRPASAGL